MLTEERLKELKEEYQGVFKVNDRVCWCYSDNGAGATYDVFLDGSYKRTVRTLDEARELAKRLTEGN